MRCAWVASASLMVIVFSLANAALVVPPDPMWQPLLHNGGLYTDTAGPPPEAVDIVGGVDDNSNTYSAGYWATDSTNVYFRMRIDDFIPPPTPPGNYVWQVLLDTDDDEYVDWSLQTDHSSSENRVELVAALNDTTVFTDVDLNPIPVWTGSWANYELVQSTTGDGSFFDGEVDGYMNIAIPWVAFTAYTGLTSTTPFRVALATSATHEHINKDVPDCWSDQFVVPEPATVTLLLLGLAGLLKRSRRDD